MCFCPTAENPAPFAPFTPVITGTTVVPPPFPTDGDLPTYAVDFETYYDKECSIRTLGAYHYCRHPLFDAYLVSIYGPGVAYVGHPRYAPWDLIKGQGNRWLSHNTGFDEEVQLYLAEIGVVPPDAFPQEWHCTADMAAYFGAPRSLMGSLNWFFGKVISKATRDKMKGQRWSEMTPEFQLEVLAYAMDDVVECRDDLWMKLSANWPAHERRLSVHTRKMGRRGLKINLPLLHEGLAKLDAVKAEARKLIPWAPEDLDSDNGVLGVKKLREICKENNIEAPASLAKDSEECAAWEDKYGDTFPWVAAMRDFRRANILGKKLRKMLQRVKPDGRMVFALKYFGASITGRWSGDSGWNSQNQNRDAVFGVRARELIIPEEGGEFLISDSSQIEPRLLAWISGNQGFLDKIREGFGVYEAFAVAKGKWPAEKKGRLKSEDPTTYKWAKAAVLGLGYGCGWAKFVEVARILAGLDISDDESKAMVADFRATETHTTGLWRGLQNGMRAHIGKDFDMKLPSGRLLRYRAVEALDGGNLAATIVKTTGGMERVVQMKYWGGILTENLIQATAREVFASILLRLEDAGIEVVMHVHDEVVCELPPGLTNEEKAAKVKLVESIMSETPSFVKGCPLGCESTLSPYYTK